MGIDWEHFLGASGVGLADAYDEQASDALYQDHSTAAPPGSPIDPGDKEVDVPFEEV